MIVVAGYKVVRNLNRPVLAVNVPPPKTTNLVFLNYVKAMNPVQEKVEAVIHNHDLSEITEVTQRAMQAPVPDARAAELRGRLLIILTNLGDAAIKANPVEGPRRPPPMDQKVRAEYEQWKKEYEEWLKVAARSYAN